MFKLLAAVSVAALCAAAAAQAAVTYTFSAAPDSGWDAFSFSFTSPTILSAGDAFSFAPFTMTNGAMSYQIGVGTSTALDSQGNCFLFASAGETLVNGAATQCSLGGLAPGHASMWFFSGDTSLPTALGTYSDRYVVVFADGAPTGTDFAGVIIISDGVPEPAAWALMIGGFGLAGVALRRRRAEVRFA